MTLHATHRLTASALCPVNGKRDFYRVTIETDGILPVEYITSFFAKHENTEIFQERLTELAKEELDPIISITTVGMHSGVETECSA